MHKEINGIFRICLYVENNNYGNEKLSIYFIIYFAAFLK